MSRNRAGDPRVGTKGQPQGHMRGPMNKAGGGAAGQPGGRSAKPEPRIGAAGQRLAGGQGGKPATKPVSFRKS